MVQWLMAEPDLAKTRKNVSSLMPHALIPTASSSLNLILLMLAHDLITNRNNDMTTVVKETDVHVAHVGGTSSTWSMLGVVKYVDW